MKRFETRALTTLAAILVGVSPAMAQDGERTFEITIENVTNSQPISPGVAVTHTGDVYLFRAGMPPSDGIVAIAEDGNPAVAAQALSGVDGVDEVVVFPFNGDGNPMPLHRTGGPGPSEFTFQITAGEGVEYLSFANMLICTNDGFIGANSIKLPKKEKTLQVQAWDAGSEVNDELASSIVPPCFGIGPVVFMDTTGNNNALPEDGGRVTGHRGVIGVGDLTGAHVWRGPPARITITPVE